MPEGLTDLHCHLLPGIDDGAKTLEDSLQMARVLVELGFSTVAPSPHNRPEYPSGNTELCLTRMTELALALAEAKIPLELAPNAENYIFDERFVPDIGTPAARKIGAAGAYVLVEAPYTAPVPPLPQMIFRVKLKGVTPVIAHPERCMEFEKKGRAEEIVRSGALLQLDLGSLTGKYGSNAKKLARHFLDEGLYALGATDLHSPVGAKEWVGKALAELRDRAGQQGFETLMRTNPGKILRGEPLDT